MTSPETADVDALLAEHTEGVAETARRLRAAVLDGVPDLDERVRRGWHSVNYAHPQAGFVCAVFPLADRVQLVLERGAQLADPRRLLGGTGKTVRTLEFHAPEEVDAEVVAEYLDEAVAVGTLARAARRRRPARS